jgi:hypothetical protein
MESMAERWTDDRIDDLWNEVEKQGDRTDLALRDLRAEMRSEMGDLRGEIGDLSKDMDVRFDQLGARLETRFDTMLYALIGLGGAMFAAMASLVAALIVTQL